MKKEKDQEQCCEKKKCSKKKKVLLWTLGGVSFIGGLFLAAKEGYLGEKAKNFVQKGKKNEERIYLEEDIITSRMPRPKYRWSSSDRNNNKELNNNNNN